MCWSVLIDEKYAFIVDVVVTAVRHEHRPLQNEFMESEVANLPLALGKRYGTHLPVEDT